MLLYYTCRILALTLPLSLVLPTTARADNFYTGNFAAGDKRFYIAEGDWDRMRLKAECADGDVMGGLSGTEKGTAAAMNGAEMMCRHSSSQKLSVGSNFKTHSLEMFANDRGKTILGDWDVGFAKAECGPKGVVAGVSQTSDRLISKILCRDNAGWTYDLRSCNVFVYNLNNNLGNGINGDGDWSQGFFKNSCSVFGQELKGVSRTQDGSIHALLCCAATPPPSQPAPPGPGPSRGLTLASPDDL